MSTGAAPGFVLQVAVMVTWSLFGFVVAALVARGPKTTAAGVSAGVLAGAGFTVLPPFAVGYLGSVIPWGQLEFWLRVQWHTLTGG